jgi:hypothetical protein
MLGAVVQAGDDVAVFAVIAAFDAFRLAVFAGIFTMGGIPRRRWDAGSLASFRTT